MHIDEFREFCLSLRGVDESFPFGEDTLVFKVLGKMFAATGLNNDDFTVNLKCDPETAIKLREEHPDIKPGYHMNKKHWNTIYFEGELDDDFIVDLILHSYDLVVAGLPKKDRILLQDL